MLLSLWESLQLQMGTAKSTNVTSCPLWFNYCFCRLCTRLQLVDTNSGVKRISPSPADYGFAAVGGQSAAPCWQDAQGHSLIAAPDQQSSQTGRQAHKCVVTKRVSTAWNVFLESPCSKRTFTIRTVSKTRNYYSFPPPSPLFTGPCHGPVGLQSASEAWKTAEIVQLQTSLATQSDDAGFTYEMESLSSRFFSKKK